MTEDKDFDFFIVMSARSANYSIKLISIETYAPQFIGHNKIFLASLWEREELNSERIFYLLAGSRNAFCAFSRIKSHSWSSIAVFFSLESAQRCILQTLSGTFSLKKTN